MIHLLLLIYFIGFAWIMFNATRDVVKENAWTDFFISLLIALVWPPIMLALVVQFYRHKM